MVGDIVKAIGIYCLGFTSGVIYTSNKFDKDPNEIFNGWKVDAQNAGQKVVDTTKSGVETIKDNAAKKKADKEAKKAEKLAEKEAKVEAEVAAAMEGGAQ